MVKKKRKQTKTSRKSYSSKKVQNVRFLPVTLVFLPLLLFAAFVSVISARNLNVSSKAAACTIYVDNNGSDGASGSQGSPIRTWGEMQRRMAAGQVFCLTSGQTFFSGLGQIQLSQSGSNGNPIVIQSVPGGQKATISSRIQILSDAKNVVFNDLNLHYRGSITNPQIAGDNITLSNNDITNFNSAVPCVQVGVNSKRSFNIVIEGNRIYNCGDVSNNQRHGLYALKTERFILRNNYIYGHADWGIQLYPDADNSLIENNIFDGNGGGITFSSEGSSTSENNVFRKNIVTNSSRHELIDQWWGGPVGTGNEVYENCIFGGTPFASGSGFTQRDNKIVDPQYQSRASADYRLKTSSPCLGWGPASAQPGGAPPAPTPPPPPPPPAPEPTPEPEPVPEPEPQVETPPPEPEPDLQADTTDSQDPNTIEPDTPRVDDTSTNDESSAPGIPDQEPTALPAIKVPDANQTRVVQIPDEVTTEQNGTIIADFTGDGLNDVVSDVNNDGLIDTDIEVVTNGQSRPTLTETSLEPIYPTKQSFDDGNITIAAGPLPDTSVPKPVAYTFFVAQGAALTGLGAYLAITKLTIFAGLRGRLGL